MPTTRVRSHIPTGASVLLLALGAPPAPPASAAEASPGLIASLREAMGGDQGFERAAVLGFIFRVEREGQPSFSRRHFWDRRAGRDRVTWKDSEGRRVQAEVSLADRRGSAERNGEPLSGAELDQALESAYAAWVNDSYWLLMPAKLGDPGVHVEDLGRVSRDGREVLRLKVSFAGVGLTPGDVYWADVNPETRLMERWEYVLEGREAPPTEWLWQDWQGYGPLTLAPVRVRPDGSARIRFLDIDVLEAAPAARGSAP